MDEKEVAKRVREALDRDKQETQARLLAGRMLRASVDGQGSGPLPYGYRRVWDQESGRYGRIVIDDHQARVVRRIFECRDLGMNLLDIALYLESKGIPA